MVELDCLQAVPFEVEVAVRIVISAVCGAIIGYERKRRQKEAGIRTHLMVAMGAAIFAIVSKYGFLDLIMIEGVRADASRIAANVVTGVSFLGAGMIFVRSKAITGLTTAAGIWAVSAIGLAFGTGMYFVGGVSTLVIMLIQYVMHRPLAALEGPSTKEIACLLEDGEKNMDDFVRICRELDEKMFFSTIEKHKDGTVLVKINLRANKGLIFEDVWQFMSLHPYIKTINF